MLEVLRVAVAALCGVVLAAPAARALSLAELEAALRAERAGWRAAPSTLPASGILPFGGAAPEDDEGEGLGFAESLGGGDGADAETQGALPPLFDWRDVTGRSYLPRAQAQGTCGSCVAFALAATLEATLNIACDAASAPFALSRQYLHSCGGASCRGGWQLSQAAAFAARAGVPDAACFPYSGDDTSCTNACADASGRAVTGLRYERPTTGIADVAAIKRALLRGPLLSSIILFEDLEFYGGGVYRHVRGRSLGSHAIVLVGWSDADRAWIALNSWGEAWGDRGYFLVDWSDSSLPGRYTYLFDVTTAKSSGVCALAR